MHWNRAKTALLAGFLLAFAGFGLQAASSNRNGVSFAQTPAPTVIPGKAAEAPSASASSVGVQPSPTPRDRQNSGPPAVFVMIDPGHGGDDPGATFGGKIAEKDITLSLGRKLKAELHERGIAARLSRDSDITLSLEQRAENANEQHAWVYVALHAGTPGPGVRVYAPALVSSLAPSSIEFTSWENAQANSLLRSQELARKIAAELGKRNLIAPSLVIPLRPLNNVIAPAVAVELGADTNDIQASTGQRVQNTVAAGIAAALAQLHPQLEGQQ